MNDIYGIIAAFDDEHALLEATERAYGEGYRSMDAYAPFPVKGLAEALHAQSSRVPLIVLIGGIIGGLSGYLLQVYASVWHYPHNIGGRPDDSWPAFIPVTFEMTILFAAVFGVIGMLWLNGLPQPYHPVFNVASFRAAASQDRFFLCIEAADPRFDRQTTAQFLQQLHAREVTEVEP